jgi:hypothetical protein
MSILHIFESTAPDGALNGNQLAYLSQLWKKGPAKWDRSYRQICYDGLLAGTEARPTGTGGPPYWVHFDCGELGTLGDGNVSRY